MPWSEKSRMELRKEFIQDYLSRNCCVSALARSYGISRKTAHKYINRYKLFGEEGLADQSRAPRVRPNQTPDEVIWEIVGYRLKHDTWGPKKIIARLSKDRPELALPCPSTAQVWLQRFGLIVPRGLKRRVPPDTQPFSACTEANDVWSIDYKGQFKMKNGDYCYPLTLVDNASRYLLLCQALRGPLFEDTILWLKWAFQEFGLPTAIRSDNGTPFATASQTGLSRLAIFLIQLSITLERIEKGHPEQNGRLERFHRTLKAETTKPPQVDLLRQQQVFSAFREEYNNYRPHEALNQLTPSDLYTRSSRCYPARILSPEYNSDLITRKVKSTGEIHHDWKSYNVCNLLAGEYVGIRVREDGILDVYYYNQLITRLDTRTGKVHGSERRQERTQVMKSRCRAITGAERRREGVFVSPRYASSSQIPPRIKEKTCQNQDDDNQ